MRTTERIIELDLTRPTPTLTMRLVQGLMKVASVWRVFRNRSEINRLHELDDNQLKDIGLTRMDLVSALLESTFFEDPTSYLTKSARDRSRLTYFHSIKRDR